MSSERYSESRTYREENRRGGPDTYNTPNYTRVSVPIQHSTNSFNSNINEQRVQDRIRHQDAALQWVNDPVTGKEKFRININIDGFNQNEVNIRVDGNKLHVYGEHLENNNQSTAKKIIEKSYELPRELETLSPQVTFPTPVTMQVDFPSRYSNTIIDDGRTSTNYISNYDTTRRTPPRLAQERSSTEYTSTRKVGGTGGSSFIGSSIPRSQSPYDDVYGGSNASRTSNYTSTNRYQTVGDQNPIRRDYTSAPTGLYNNNSTNPTSNFRVTTTTTGGGGGIGDSQPRTIYPSSSTSFRNGDGNTHEKSYTETHRETEQRRSSPTSGVQSSRESEHHRSGNPSLGQGLDGDRFRTNITFDRPNLITPSTIARNVEVREYSRRVGNTGNTGSSFINTEPLFLSRDFNTDAFYRSAFQPQVFTDNLGQQRIEMKLPVNDYQPNEIKVKMEGNDLIVQAEHNDERPPASSSRAYFYKQITLPPNTDLSTLSSQYNQDGRLHITAKLSPEKTSIKYN